MHVADSGEVGVLEGLAYMEMMVFSLSFNLMLLVLLVRTGF